MPADPGKKKRLYQSSLLGFRFWSLQAIQDMKISFASQLLEDYQNHNTQCQQVFEFAKQRQRISALLCFWSFWSSWMGLAFGSFGAFG